MADQHRRPTWVKAAVAGFLAFELGAAAFLLRPDRGVRGDPPRAAATPATRQRPAEEPDDRRAREVGALLERRAGAIRARDRATFASTLDPTRTEFVRTQLAMFDALKDVPISAWRYDLDADDTRPAPAAYKGTEAWAPAATLRYQLAGYDDEPPAVAHFFTFVRRDGAWLTASDSDFDRDPGRRTGRELWDFGPVAVAKAKRAIVLGHRGQYALLREVAALADAAVPRVTKVWGTEWPQRVVVLVPGSQAEVEAILGDGTDLERIAAVAVAELPGDTGTRPVGNRIIVNPPNFRKLGANGRRVVITHETTHVATRDASRAGIPTWLVEGFADYVGYLGTGLSPRAICQELAADVRAGRAPAQLPKDTDFDGGNDRLAQAYESSWLAVRMIVERVGEKRLVEFYERAGATDVATAMREVLDTTPESFTKAWRAYVQSTLG